MNSFTLLAHGLNGGAIAAGAMGAGLGLFIIACLIPTVRVDYWAETFAPRANKDAIKL